MLKTVIMYMGCENNCRKKRVLLRKRQREFCMGLYHQIQNYVQDGRYMSCQGCVLKILGDAMSVLGII
jgi:hypothetical protein